MLIIPLLQTRCIFRIADFLSRAISHNLEFPAPIAQIKLLAAPAYNPKGNYFLWQTIFLAVKLINLQTFHRHHNQFN